MTLTIAVNMPGTDLRRPLASSLWKSPGKKKPEVDCVLHHEACVKLAVKFHPLTGTFDLLLHVSFTKTVGKFETSRKKEQRNRKTVFF